jgi:AcrR family transcriptional regulator
MAAKKLSTEIRKEQIAGAALEMLGSRGIGELSLADIAQRIGLVPSAIYRHFESKDEVLDAVLDLIGRRLLNNVEASQAESGDALQRLRGLLVRQVQLVRENPAIPRIMFSDDVLSRNEKRKATVYTIVRAYLKEVAELVRQGQRQKVIRGDLDADTAALLLLGIIQPAAVLWHLSGRQFDLAQHAEQAWGLFHAAVSSSEK